jgi:hypothetical protein
MSPSFACLTLCAFALAMKVSITSAAEPVSTSAEARARAFTAAHEATIRPMEIVVNLAWWRANTTVKEPRPQSLFRRRSYRTVLQLSVAAMFSHPRATNRRRAVHQHRPQIETSCHPLRRLEWRPSRTLVGIVLSDIFALQVISDASFFRFRERDSIRFCRCEAGSRCEKSNQSQNGRGNASHGDLR